MSFGWGVSYERITVLVILGNWRAHYSNYYERGKPEVRTGSFPMKCNTSFNSGVIKYKLTD